MHSKLQLKLNKKQVTLMRNHFGCSRFVSSYGDARIGEGYQKLSGCTA
ncbi:helix-turn-helix domain-containing protein [Microcoleus sp. ARI1-B5]